MQPDHYSVGIISISLVLLAFLILFIIDLPHYRRDYKRLMKRNVKSYIEHRRAKKERRNRRNRRVETSIEEHTV